MDRRTFITAFAALAGASAAGSALAKGAADPVAAPAAPAAPATFEPSDYVLGPGDKLRLIVFGEETLSGEFVIASNGTVALPLIGDVQAAGLTVRDFQGKVEDELRKGYLRDPRVSAEVLNYRPFYILGEVNKPGEYPYTNGLTVLNAIATAGGFTYRAKTNKAYIRRANETSERAYDMSSVLTVAPGDTIRIAERFL
ncbi:MAG: periplasmic protein involved in polysaccharide export [Caulobacter sp.]|nr:periplasmic protein involved in polysaccharide export [Caulobacter sp.]